MKIALIIAGWTAVFVASLLLVAKPPAHLIFTLPAMPAIQNIPYYLYLRSLQAILGFQPGVLMLANGFLMWLTLGNVFRAGWGWADERYRIGGAALALLIVLFHPLAIVLPLTLGFFGGFLMVPLLLVILVNVMLGIDHWSAFMRALTLAVAWSFFLWVHLPTAVYILVAMAVWVIYSRRPMTSLGILLSVFFLGTTLFSVLWTLGCLITRRWSMIQTPVGTACTLMQYFYQGASTGWRAALAALPDRMVHIAGWMSPFLLILGLWVTAKSIVQMVRERRASTADLTALIALIILAASVFTSGKDELPGAWHLLSVVVLWAPLIARTLAQKENFFSRGFRLTLGVAFLMCAIILWLLQTGVAAGRLVPDAGTLAKLVAAMALTGGGLHLLLKRHPLTWENRLQAFLTGSMVAYFLVVDVMLLR